MNAKMYLESILKAIVYPWAKNTTKNQHWTYRQDWASAHGVTARLEICKRLFPSVWDKDVWPSNAPNLNPLDFSVWSILGEKVCATWYESVESLKFDLEKPGTKFSNDGIAGTDDTFIKRSDAFIEASGGHFEQLFV